MYMRTIIIVGPHLAGLIRCLEEMCDQTRQYQASRPNDLLWSFSIVCEGGGVLRVAGKEIEEVRKWLRGTFLTGGVAELVGDGLWPRII